eukprot:gnl/TRDRNA2_/TRDRNA2_167780_c0_seq1.p1 gnl/TRDRNA2_/TRDRNA2_167780_c0~~gnl/TRDRNA2_/TRDRNA2_167780_c0_seq1.p1  ORF type:complete len:582 (+),score=118.39 gnl/TRDRNA2_/TRDRNA2_167780_c0_seq1:52-1746(+)
MSATATDDKRTSEHFVLLAAKRLHALVPNQRPATEAALANWLKSKGCCSTRLHVQQPSLVAATLPLISDAPSLHEALARFAVAPSSEGDDSEAARTAARRVAATLRGPFGEQFVRYDGATQMKWLCAQGYATLTVDPAALVKELMHRGIVAVSATEKGASCDRLNYTDSSLATASLPDGGKTTDSASALDAISQFDVSAVASLGRGEVSKLRVAKIRSCGGTDAFAKKCGLAALEAAKAAQQCHPAKASATITAEPRKGLSIKVHVQMMGSTAHKDVLQKSLKQMVGAEIAALMPETVFDGVAFPPSSVKKLKVLQDKLRCAFQLDRDKGIIRVTRLSAASPSDESLREILTILAGLRSETVVKIISRTEAGAVIGRLGGKISRIESEHNAALKFTQRGDDKVSVSFWPSFDAVPDCAEGWPSNGLQSMKDGREKSEKALEQKIFEVLKAAEQRREQAKLLKQGLPLERTFSTEHAEQKHDRSEAIIRDKRLGWRRHGKTKKKGDDEHSKKSGEHHREKGGRHKAGEQTPGPGAVVPSFFGSADDVPEEESEEDSDEEDENKKE